MEADFQQIKQAILHLSSFQFGEWEAFSSKLTLKMFKKGDFLITQGQVENHMYFLNQGATRNYFLHEGKEFTVDFHFAGEFVTAFYSFITRDPSPVSIELLAHTEAVAIRYEDLQLFYNQFQNGQKTGRLLAERQYIRRLRKEMDLLSLTAEERYAQLMERNPELVQTISVKHLSSYLGIQPESLSRIRKLYTRN